MPNAKSKFLNLSLFLVKLIMSFVSYWCLKCLYILSSVLLALVVARVPEEMLCQSIFQSIITFKETNISMYNADLMNHGIKFMLFLI